MEKDMITVDGLTDNQYGMSFVTIELKALRVHRTDGKWLVEYRRKPRPLCFWDYFWWYDDGTYVEYIDALDRVEYLKQTKKIVYPVFQENTVIQLDEEEDEDGIFGT